MNLRKLGRMSGIVAAIALLAMALQGCGGDDGEVDQSLYDSVVNEREAALAAQEAAEEAAAEAQAEAEAAQAKAAEAQAKAAEAQAKAAAAAAQAEAAVVREAQAEAEAAQAEAEAAVAREAQAEAEAAQAEAEAAQAEAEAAAAAAQEAAQAQMEQDAEAAQLARLARVNAAAIQASAMPYDHDDDSTSADSYSVSAGFQGDIQLPGDTKDNRDANNRRIEAADEEWLTLAATRAGSTVTFKATAGGAVEFEFDATAGAAGMTEVDMPGGRTQHIHLMSDIQEPGLSGATFADYAAFEIEAGRLGARPFDSEKQETSYQVILFDGNDKIDGDFPIPTVLHNVASLPEGSERTGTYDGVPGVYRCSGSRCAFELQDDGTVMQTDSGFDFIPDGDVAIPDTDYLVYGAWLTVPDSVAGEAEAAAIAAGSDLFTGSNIEGLTGEATYEGSAAGFYADRPVDSDAAVSGTFTATATLEADFGTASELGSLEGEITDFVRDDGAEVDWLVTLDAVTLTDDDGGFVSGSTGGFADGAAWNGDGEWGIQIVGDGADVKQHPSGVVGTFGAERGMPDPVDDGDEGFTGVIGGFGARN